MSDKPQRVTRHKPSRRMLAFAAVYGAVVATVAHVVAGSNPFWMLVVMIIIGVLFRLYAYRLIRRRGAERPPWWKWL
jgi:Flp pilus assembly protein TadB